MKIDLLNVDEKGQEFQFDELSDELEGAFTDLIGDNRFRANVEIRPLGNTYQVSGGVTSHYPDTCSKCGYDIDVPLQHKINEIVVIEKARPRNTQVSQSGQNFDTSGPSVTYINDAEFDLVEFLHEMMASGFSQYPKCQDTDLCESRQHQYQADEPEETPVGHPGFASLKNFKAKH